MAFYGGKKVLTVVKTETKTILGDGFKQLIEGTITEISDDTITNVKNYVIQNCASLTSVDLPNATRIGTGAFSHCIALKSVNIPNATSIEQNAFYNCRALTTIDLPNATAIGKSAFEQCIALKSVILRATSVCSLDSYVFNHTPIATSTTEGFIYVNDDLVEEYKVATNWTTYASKIKPLSELTN